MDKEPKDFYLARRAYEAFYDEQPQIWFDQLSHDYQMRWVRAARAVLDDAKTYKHHVSGTIPEAMTEQEARRIIAEAPKKRGGAGTRVDHTAISKTESIRVKRAYDVLKNVRRTT